MKIKIVGWLYIITSPIFFLSFLILVVAPLLFRDGLVDDLNQIWQGGLALIFGIYAFTLGSAIKSYKKWSWYAGIVTMFGALIGNVGILINAFSPILIIAILIEIFSIYALIGEKNLFFHHHNLLDFLSLFKLIKHHHLHLLNRHNHLFQTPKHQLKQLLNQQAKL